MARSSELPLGVIRRETRTKRSHCAHRSCSFSQYKINRLPRLLIINNMPLFIYVLAVLKHQRHSMPLVPYFERLFSLFYHPQRNDFFLLTCYIFSYVNSWGNYINLNAKPCEYNLSVLVDKLELVLNVLLAALTVIRIFFRLHNTDVVSSFYHF